jgi:hypothetical protein
VEAAEEVTMSEFVPVTVSVPRSKVPDLLRYAAGLASDPDVEDVSNGSRLSEAAVKAAYQGGVSEYWRPFLELLASESLASRDGWVAWPKLYNQLGLSGHQAAGMLGAAERRLLRQELPYEKTFENGKYKFRMSQRVAELVLETAGR